MPITAWEFTRLPGPWWYIVYSNFLTFDNLGVPEIPAFLDTIRIAVIIKVIFTADTVLFTDVHSPYTLCLPSMTPITKKSDGNALSLFALAASLRAFLMALAFDLTDEFEAIYAQILNSPTGKFSSEDINKVKGLPKSLTGGNRIFYTRQDGLSRLYLGRYLNLDSDSDDLAYSYGDGRVVLESGEATSQKISQYLINLHRQRRDLEAQLQKVKEAEELIRKK